MNGYTGGYVPAPWERFFASTRPYQASPPLTFYENMGLGSEGPEYTNNPTRHLDTYLLRDVAVREISRWGADRPLFMVVSFHGPHIPAFFDAADADQFADLKAPRVPSWGVSDADDPQYVKNQAPSPPRKPGCGHALPQEGALHTRYTQGYRGHREEVRREGSTG